MLKYKHALVIGYFGFVNALIHVDCEGGKEVPVYYHLTYSQSLIYKDIEIALNMRRPQWNGNAWIETKFKAS